MIDERGQKTVTVTKKQLLDELQMNRHAHRRVFDLAIAGWQKRCIAELEQAVADAKSGFKFSGVISIPKPQDQTSDYDRVIKMVQMSVGDNVTLSAEDFACYVMDDWRWKSQFTASTSMYVQ